MIESSSLIEASYRTRRRVHRCPSKKLGANQLASDRASSPVNQVDHFRANA
jgi:hypothetical protein